MGFWKIMGWILFIIIAVGLIYWALGFASANEVQPTLTKAPLKNDVDPGNIPTLTKAPTTTTGSITPPKPTPKTTIPTYTKDGMSGPKSCITKLDSQGRKMNLVIPWSGKVIEGKYCQAFNMVERKIMWEYSKEESDILLDVRWFRQSNPRHYKVDYRLVA